MIQEQMPKHIGIIMDGNGRWAKQRLLPRDIGHKQGAKTFEKITSYANSINLKHLTFFAFSTENFSRPENEINTIFDLMRSYLKELSKDKKDKNIRINFIGDLSRLPADIQEDVDSVQKKTINNTGLVCNIAVNYGGRQDILAAAKKLATNYKNGKLSSLDSFGEDDFSQLLYTTNQPELDLLVRTSGEQRISNFLLWQAAYAELVFTDVLWPDFNNKDLDSAIEIFMSRNRRYGGV